MKATQRLLSHYRVGISISDGEDSDTFGYPVSEVNRTTIRMVASLLGQGAGVSFGHDWRDDGVMQAIHAYAERYRPVAGEVKAEPLLWNLVPWPDKPKFSENERDRLKLTLRVEKVGLPDTLREYEKKYNDLEFNYLRARGLTHLRHRLTDISNARVCFGGRLLNYSGRYPGIVEEALFAVQKGLPLYLVGFLGGAARQVIFALKNKNKPEDLIRNKEQIILFLKPVIDEQRLLNLVPSSHDTFRDDLKCIPNEVWHTFVSLEVNGLSKRNGLSEEENERLFNTFVVEEAIELVLTGLGRLNKDRDINE